MATDMEDIIITVEAVMDAITCVVVIMDLDVTEVKVICTIRIQAAKKDGLGIR